jgi:hypothetical protein
MYCTRSALIELIEQVDQIHVGSSPIITELVQWLPTSMIDSFIEDAKQALEIGDPEVDDPTELAEDHFINAGIEARECLKLARRAADIPAFLELMQCSEV